MFYTGCHLSSVKGFENMGREALSIGASTFQFFTRNPRGGKAKAIDEDDVRRFLELASENGFGKLVAHAPYTLNPCSGTDRVRAFAYEACQMTCAGWSTSPETITMSIREVMWDRASKKVRSSSWIC